MHPVALQCAHGASPSPAWAPASPHQRASHRLHNLLEQAADAAGADVEIFGAINIGDLEVPIHDSGVEYPAGWQAEPDCADWR
ncbi:hypothetical protein [Streptomyces sp. YGL11-2]|uniref:hypothetical protein n=1 Tax=Streptomyces sp. YGL11-2 TaxID=3414028 RepID=UPI003CEABBF5